MMSIASRRHNHAIIILLDLPTPPGVTSHLRDDNQHDYWFGSSSGTLLTMLAPSFCYSGGHYKPGNLHKEAELYIIKVLRR